MTVTHTSANASALTPAQSRTVWLLSMATFSSMAVQRICDPMLPVLAQEFHTTLSQVALVVSLFAVTHGLMQLIYGPLGDRWGKYRLVKIATLGCGVGSLLCSLSGDLNQLVMARISTALFAAAIVPLTMAWIGDHVVYALRQETLARMGLGTMLGLTMGQWMGGLLTDTVGWRWGFALMASLFLGVAALLWRHDRQLPHTPAKALAQSFVATVFSVLSISWARTLMLFAFLEGAAVFGVVAVSVAHLHNTFGLSLTWAGGISALFGLGGMGCMATAKHSIARWGEQGMAKVGGTLLGLSFLLLAFTPWWWLALPACTLSGFGFALIHNALQANATQMAPQARGTAVSMFASALFLGQSVGVLSLTQLMTYAPSSQVLALGALIVFGLTVAVARALRQKAAQT